MFVRDDRGFTLVEMMVALVIAFLLVGWAFSTYLVHHRVFTTESQITEMQYEGGTALSVISRDVMESGFGVPDDPNVNGVTSSVVISDSGDNGGPDSITLLGGYRVVATLAGDVVPGMTTLTVNWIGNPMVNTTDRSYISIEGLSFFTVTDVNNNVVTLSSPVDRFYPAGRPIYLVEDVTYFVSNGALLRASPTTNAAGEPVATNVDDFQCASLDFDGDGDIDAVRISLLARTEREVAQKVEPGVSSITLENNTVTTSDYFRRRVYRQVVYLRNRVR